MTGIDISGVQGDDVPGAWEFIVVKSSEGMGFPNPRLSAQWANAKRTTRGLYHYARPLKSTGTVQAQLFANDALARGFKPGVDIWQLDAEAGENEQASGTTWRVFIDDFMRTATNMLGRRGFMYAGWPFLVEHGLTDLPYRYMWWLPDYGRNDGQDHGMAAGVPTGLVVIHQFTSVPSLDQNHVLNPLAYQQLPPTPEVLVQPEYSPALNMLPWTAAWHNPDGSVRAAVAANGDVYAFGVPFRPWPNQHKDLANMGPINSIGPLPGDKTGKRYQLKTADGHTYAP